MCRLLLVGLLSAGIALPLQAQAIVFQVDRTDADLPDADPGDGDCEVAGRGCTLRAAIMEANAQLVLGSTQYYVLLPLDADILIEPPALPAIDRNLAIQVNAPNAFQPPPVPAAQRPRIRAGFAAMNLLSVAPGRTLALRDVALSESLRAVSAEDADVIAQRVRIHDNLGIETVAIEAQGLLIEDSEVLDNLSDNESVYFYCHALRAQSLQMRRSRVQGNAYLGSLSNRFAVCAGSGSLIEDSDVAANSHHGISGNDLLLRRSTVRDHAAGAALRSSPQTLRLENVTFSGNAAGLQGTLTDDYLVVEIVASTFVANGIDIDLDKNDLFAGGTLWIMGSALSACTFPPGLTRSTNHYNLAPLASTCVSGETNRIGSVEAAFAPLAGNDGRVPTHAPLPGSLALDFGPPSAMAGCLEHDARGFPRPHDGDGDGLARCDIGAVELGAGQVFAHGFED